MNDIIGPSEVNLLLGILKAKDILGWSPKRHSVNCSFDGRCGIVNGRQWRKLKENLVTPR